MSGGYDSSLISAISQKLTEVEKHFITLEFDNKEPTAKDAYRLFEHIKDDKSYHHKIEVTIEEYLRHMQRSYTRLLSPLPTHSYPSFSIACEKAKGIGARVLYTGDGPDELYGGYSAYKEDLREGTNETRSPYTNLIKLSDELLNDISPDKTGAELDIDSTKYSPLFKKIKVYSNLRATGPARI